MFDTTIAIAAEIGELRRRLTARWEHYRLPEAEVAAKVEGNDLANARLVMTASAAAEFMLAG
jgi:pantothenate kinase